MGYFANAAEFRKSLVADGEHDLAELGDGELEEAMRLGEQDAAQVKQLRNVEKMLSKLTALEAVVKNIGGQRLDVKVDGVPLRDAAQQMAAVAEQMARATEEALAAFSASMKGHCEAIVKAVGSIPAPQVAPTQVTVDFDRIERVLKSFMSVTLEKASRQPQPPKVVNQVAVPRIHVDVDPMTKALSNLVGALSEQKQPVVTVAPRVDPVIHVHVPRIKTATQIVERDGDGEVIGSTTTYTYED